MGYRKTPKPHVKRLSNVAKRSLKLFRGFVLLVGKPLYFIFFITLKTFGQTLDILQKKLLQIFKNKPLPIKFYLVILYTFILLLFYLYILIILPSPKDLQKKPPPLSTKIYDRNGVLLYKIYGQQNRSYVSLSEIPQSAILATLAIEDNEFYKHPGFSIKGMARALLNNIKKDTLYGGSTITQQLVKNTLLTPEKSIKRKINELVLALEVELTYSKNEILEMYLNISPYGGPVYGIKEAANFYFDKNVSDLTLAESAFLAGIPKSPNNFSPFIGGFNNSFNRQKKVLDLMHENKYITNYEYQKAISEKLNFSDGKINILAPHFVMYVKNILDHQYGEDVVSRGGFEVKTTLDLNIQKMAEDVVSSELSILKNYHVTNAGVLIIEPKTGEILAMVGSNNYFDITNNGNVNTLFSLRPPGSTIKVVNYAYALENGYTLASTIDDSPITFRSYGSPDYSPVNYDNIFKGNISIRSAFAQSRNVPAVKILYSYGVNNMINMGQLLGITTWTDNKNYGLSITLGGASTTLFDLAKVYSIFADYGIKKDLNPIKNIMTHSGAKIADNECNKKTAESNSDILPTIPNNNRARVKIMNLFSGKLVSSLHASSSADENHENIKSCNKEQVVDPRVAFLITNVLSDNYARTPTFGSNSQLNIKDHSEVAVKTGTSNSMRDNISIGYNQDYLVAVWVGNNDNSPMSNIASGITGATPIFNKIMTNLLKNKPKVNWHIPNGVVRKEVCIYSKNEESGEVIVNKYSEWFLEENLAKNICQGSLKNN